MLTFILLLFLRADNKETGRLVRSIMSNNAREAALEEQQGRRILPARRVKRQPAQEGGKMFKVALRGVSRPFFAGTTFKLSGFSMQRQTELSVWIVEAEGEIVLSDNGVKVDYLVVPVECREVTAQTIAEKPHKHLVADLWIEDCLDSGLLLSIGYHHGVVGQIQGQPLKGVVACISGYLGTEREFLSNLVVAMGGVIQEVFAKRDNPMQNVVSGTHLVCAEAKGLKYNAAKKWKIPVVTKDWLCACLRENAKVLECEFLPDEVEEINKSVEVVEIGEAAADIAMAQASPVPTISGVDGNNEEEVAKIAEQASKKMKLEVDAKVKEMENLKQQKEEAIKKVERISRKIEAERLSADHHKDALANHKKDDEVDRLRQKKLQEELSAVIERRRARKVVVYIEQGIIGTKAVEQRAWAQELEETKDKIKKLEEKLEGLPADPGFSHDVINLLDHQIASKKKELECPVCLEESAPPIYTCVAQHLVCAKCR